MLKGTQLSTLYGYFLTLRRTTMTLMQEAILRARTAVDLGSESVKTPVAKVATFTPYTCKKCKGSGRLTLHAQNCPRCTKGIVTELDEARYQRYLDRKASGKTMDFSLKSYR
jgi:hypothetical protein